MTKRFERSFEKLDRAIKRSFMDRKNLLLADSRHPMLNLHKLQGKFEGYWSMNITGDVRLIFKMEGFIAIMIDIGRHSTLFGN